jgi:hypothetical protein
MRNLVTGTLIIILVFIHAFAFAAPALEFNSQSAEINVLNSLPGSKALQKSIGSGTGDEQEKADDSTLIWIGAAAGVTLVCLLAIELGKPK